MLLLLLLLLLLLINYLFIFMDWVSLPFYLILFVSLLRYFPRYLHVLWNGALQSNNFMQEINKGF